MNTYTTRQILSKLVHIWLNYDKNCNGSLTEYLTYIDTIAILHHLGAVHLCPDQWTGRQTSCLPKNSYEFVVREIAWLVTEEVVHNSACQRIAGRYAAFKSISWLQIDVDARRRALRERGLSWI